MNARFRRPSNVARRWFVWTVTLALLGMWAQAIAEHQNQWPIAGVMALVIFVYVTAASAEQVVTLFVQGGIARAAAGPAAAVAEAIGGHDGLSS